MDGLVRNDEARRGGRAKACGPDPPMLGSSLPMMIGRRRWLEKPGHRGERAISRKPLRRECRNVRRTCTTCVRMHLPFCTQGCGCVSASGKISPAPSLIKEGHATNQNPGAIAPRDRGSLCSAV